MKLRVTIFAVIFALAVACGGDDDSGGSDASSGGSGGASSGGSTANTPGASSGSSGSGSGGGFVSGIPAGTAVVTIGDESFEFNMSGACLTGFGAVGGAGSATDGSDVKLSIDIRPADLGPSDIRVQDDREDRPVDWQADEELMDSINGVSAGQSQVDSFNIGPGATGGTATFIDSFAILLGESPQPVKGTFSVNCGS